MALIELDREAPVRPPAGPIPPAHHYRMSGLAAAVALVCALGGATVGGPVLFRPRGTAALTAEGSFQLAGGRLYTFDVAGAVLSTTAWSATPMRRLWRTTSVVTPATEDGQPTDPGLGWYVRAAAGDGVLLQSELDATVLDARTGAVRWRAHAPVTVVAAGRVGLVADEHYPPGAQWHPEAAGGTGVYAGATGELHQGPPDRTDLRAYDMRSGRRLWTIGFPGPAVIAGPPYDPALVAAVTADRIVLVDPLRGTVRQVVPLPRTDGATEVRAVGELLLVRRAGTLAAYRWRTLTPVWRHPQPAAQDGDQVDCPGLPCAVAPGATVLLDPVTGRPRWRTGTGSTLSAWGGDRIVEVGNRRNQPLRVRAAATGWPVTDLRPWTWLTPADPGDALLLGRIEDTGTVLGALTRGRTAVQLLGRVPAPLADCQADLRLVACRTAAGVGVWSYLG